MNTNKEKVLDLEVPTFLMCICNSGLVKVLCNQYNNSSEIAASTATYFQGLSLSARSGNIAIWTAKIERAEFLYLNNPCIMDIYGIWAEGSSNSTVLERDYSDCGLLVDVWITQALLVEEAQWVYLLLPVTDD